MLCYSGSAAPHVFQSWRQEADAVAGQAEDIARTRPLVDWTRLSQGRNKGRAEWLGVYLDWPISEVEEFYSAIQGLWTRGLLIRRNIADVDLASSEPGVQREHPSKRW